MTKKSKNSLFQKYRGKHIIIIAGEVFASTTGKDAAKIFKKIIKNHPNQKPTITYIPKEDTLILWLKRQK